MKPPFENPKEHNRKIIIVTRRLWIKPICTVLFCFVLSALFTWFVIIQSEAYGKLAIPPDYDDSHSLVEGGLRYLSWKAGGLKAALQHYLSDLPHSFLHYYFVTACFALFGVNATAVYAAGGVFIFLVALGCAQILRPAGFARAMLLTAAVLCLPVAFNIIHDFRSECAMAVLLFAGCCVVMHSAWQPSPGRWWAVLAGALFALALGIKPAMFIYVLGVAACCSFVWAVAAWTQKKSPWSGTAVWIGILWLVMIVPFSFHFVLNAQQIFGYILTNAFTSDFWKQKGTFWDQMVFHYHGFPGVFQLGVFRYPLTIITAVGLVWSVFAKIDACQLLRRYLWSCVFLAITAYAGVAINSINQNHFSMTFHLLFGLSAALSVVLIAQAFSPVRGNLICLLATVAALLFWHIPISQDYVARTREVGGDAALSWRREGPRQVFELVRAAWKSSGVPKIWVGAYGWVDGNTITWEAILEGLPWKMWNHYARPPEAGNLYPDWADVLVIPEPDVMGTIELPLNKTLPEMNQAASEDTGLELMGDAADPNGRKVHVFLRKPIAPEAVAP